jgi:hypothetical protein
VQCAGNVQVFGRRRDVLSTRTCGRRLKSAKARNRGRWGTRRGSERYGDLCGSWVPVRFDGSGLDDRFRSKNCGIDFERAPCALRERIWGGAAGRCGATMQAGLRCIHGTRENVISGISATLQRCAAIRPAICVKCCPMQRALSYRSLLGFWHRIGCSLTSIEFNHAEESCNWRRISNHR